MSKSNAKLIPIHQWTNESGLVLILKCVDSDGKGHGGFQWPESGPVRPDAFSRKPDCESGGLFGWPWGLGFGEGKEPDYAGRWIVFAAHPDDVIAVAHSGLIGKCKAVPNDKAGRCPEVVYCGDLGGAIAMLVAGQLEWSKSLSGAATNSGESGAATNSGYSGAATNSGESGAATNSGERGAATNSGYRGAATNSGYSGAATNSGERGAATNSGESGAATNSGYRGAATNSGYRGIAVNTGEMAVVETSPTGIAAVCAERWLWRYRPGAVAVSRWDGGATVLLRNLKGVKDGDLVKVERNKIVKKWDWE